MAKFKGECMFCGHNPCECNAPKVKSQRVKKDRPTIVVAVAEPPAHVALPPRRASVPPVTVATLVPTPPRPSSRPDLSPEDAQYAYALQLLKPLLHPDSVAEVSGFINVQLRPTELASAWRYRNGK